MPAELGHRLQPSLVTGGSGQLCGGSCWWAVVCLGSRVLGPSRVSPESVSEPEPEPAVLTVYLSVCLAVLICLAYICKCYAVPWYGVLRCALLPLGAA